MRNNLATHNVIGVSAQHREPALNVPIEMDTAMLVSTGDILALKPQIETNADEADGHEEATRIYNLGGTTEGPMTYDKMQPQHLALLAAYGLGACTTVAAGASGFQHTITPMSGDLDDGRSNPSFTAAQRLGLDVIKTLAVSMFVDSFTLDVQENSWIKLTGQLKGTGYIETNKVIEEVAGTNGDATVTLDANAVEGADAATRLNSVERVRFMESGDDYWTEVDFSAVSGATPAVITITPPLAGGSDAGTFEVTYAPDEDTSLDTGSATSDPPNDTTGVLTDTAGTMVADEHIGRWLVMTSGTADGRFWKITDNDATTITCDGANLYAAGVRSADTYLIRQFGWLPLPGLVDQPPLRVSQVEVVFGGEWDGTSFNGGRQMSHPLKGLQWTVNNNLTPVLGPGAGQSSVANRAYRESREQTLSMDREMRDAMLTLLAQSSEPDYFGLRLAAWGPEYEAGYRYGIEIIWPKLAVTAADPQASGKRLSASAQIAVLEHATYGSVIVRVYDKVATYAAA